MSDIVNIEGEFLHADSTELSENDEEINKIKPVIISNEFLLKSSFKISSKKNQFVSANRIINNDTIAYQSIIHSPHHNCYIGLKIDGSLVLINRSFEEVYKIKSASATILCMIYNSITDELFTSSIDGIRIWSIKKGNDTLGWKSIKQMCNYSLALEKEWLKFAEDWIKNMELDAPNCHLYCCSDTSLYILDFNGNLLRHFNKIHQLPITSCAYSPTTKLLITGGLDCLINVWSLTGALVETFKAHSKSITKLVINPHNSNIILSSSLDGFIKMWSMDIMQLIYEFDLDRKEIFWMNVTEDNHLYVASKHELNVFSVPNIVDFWAILKDKAKKMYIIDSSIAGNNKKSKFLTWGEENTLRIYSRKNESGVKQANQITGVLPIPILRENNKILSVAYSIVTNSLYVLIENSDLWVYFTKTNPCTKASIWNVQEMQQYSKFSRSEDEEFRLIKTKERLKKQSVNIEMLQTISKKHRSLEIHLNYLVGNSSELSKCRCIAILESDIIFWNIEGACCPPYRLFLLLGLENGSVLFCDPLIKNKKFSILNCDKDPVVEIVHKKSERLLVTRVEGVHLFHIQYWRLPDLELEYYSFCSRQMSSFCRCKDTIVFGYNDGSLELARLKRVNATDPYNNIKFPNESETSALLAKLNARFEHKQRVESIDIFLRKEIFMTCSYDGCIKIWTCSLQLLAEISLDNSLSSCLFSSQKQCDLVLGWKNHLFTISLGKLIPHLNEDDEAFLEIDDLEDAESFVVDEPNLMTTNKIEPPFQVDLNNYLHPFDVKLTDSGKFAYKDDYIDMRNSKKAKLEQQTQLAVGEKISERSTTTTPQPFPSSLPESFFTSPRNGDENPQANLKLVDLTLEKFDLHRYLIDLFTEFSECLFPQAWTNFPKFGDSPTSTPSCTPPPQTPTPTIVVDEEKRQEPVVQVVVEHIEQARTTFVKKKPMSDDEMNKKIQDRLPLYQRTNINEIRINSKSILQSSSSSAKMDSRKAIEVLKKPEMPTQFNRSIEKRKSTIRRASSIKPKDSSIKQVMNNEDFPKNKTSIFKAEKEQATTIEPTLKLLDIGSNMRKEVKLSKRKSINSIRLVRSNSPNDEKETISSISGTLNSTLKTHPEGEETTLLNSKNNIAVNISEQSDSGQNQATNMINEELQTNLVEIENAKKAEKEKSQIDGRSRLKVNRRSLFISGESWKQLDQRDTDMKLYKTRLLFDFINGKSGLPVRMGSGSYKLPFELHENKEKELIKRIEEARSKSRHKPKEEVLDLEMTRNRYIMNWLENYEFRRSRLDFRMERAKINQKNQTQTRRADINSAIVVSKTTNPEVLVRPKSVTFSFKNESKQAETPINIAKPIIHLQPTYLVSQIEMEQILEEVGNRVSHNRIQQQQQQQQSQSSRSRSGSDSEKSRGPRKTHSNISRTQTVDINSDMYDNGSFFGDYSNRVVDSSSRNSSAKLNYHRKNAEEVASSYLSYDHTTTGSIKSSKACSRASRRKNSSYYWDDISLTEYRLSLKSFHESTENNNISKVNDYSSDDSGINNAHDLNTKTSKNRKNRINMVASINKHLLEGEPRRLRTPSSIPSKSSWSSYFIGNQKSLDSRISNRSEKDEPSIQVEYRIPNSPEKYLIPIRFPIMYANIINYLKYRSLIMEKKSAIKQQTEEDNPIYVNSLA